MPRPFPRSASRTGAARLDLGLNGRTAIVCGASAGMGLAIARARLTDRTIEAFGDINEGRRPARGTSRFPGTPPPVRFADRPLHGRAKTLAREIGPDGITVNSIAPGRIETERLVEVYPDGPTEADLQAIPLRRFGPTRGGRGGRVLLASDRASYVTGTTIAVDGGLARSTP